MKKKQFISIDLGNPEMGATSLRGIIDFIDDSKKLLIKVPIPCSRTMLDVAYSYLYASYILETLANNFDHSNITCFSQNEINFSYGIFVENYEEKELAHHIVEFYSMLGYGPCLNDEDEDEDEDEYFNLIEKISDYESNLSLKKLHFPDVIDLYFANLINGGLNEDDDEYFTKVSSENPEYKYGYWIGARYLNKADKVLYSRNCWIVSNLINIEKLFDKDCTKNHFSTIPANLLVINSQGVIVSENGVAQISMGEVIQGVACINDVFDASSLGSNHHLDSFDGQFFSSFNEKLKLEKNKENQSFINSDNIFEIHISEFGEFAIFKLQKASLVLFNTYKPTYSKSKAFIKAMLTIGSSFNDGILTSSSVELDWYSLNDELFEQLCYDIIYHNSKFDRNTIRKMGNSRSRDGGRDIVVYTKELNNRKPRKFIFQCKFMLSKNSLNTSNIGSISDVIDQYGVDGYGIICNKIIDSTLYDRLDGIGINRKVEIDTWSRLEVERFIARRPIIKERYF